MTPDNSLLLDRLEALHTHRVYRPEYIAAMLSACGVEADLGDNGSSVIIAGMEVTGVEPEWGMRGISPQSLISAVCKTITGEAPQSSMIGRGFWYRDVLSQLREAVAHLPRSGSEPGPPTGDAQFV
jgi:hypothetical protein